MTRTPTTCYEIPILEVLYDLGRARPSRTCRPAPIQRLNVRLRQLPERATRYTRRHPSTRAGRELDLRDIWGTSATNVYAVGEAGVVIRYDGTQWTQQPGISPRQSLNAIWGSSPTDIFAVGDFGMVLHYDGTSWSSQESGTAEHLFGVGGCDASNVYAVGLHGTILRYDGIKWHPEGSGTTVSLLDVWGDIAAMWAVGDHGTILQKTNPCPPIPTPIPGVSPLGLGVLAGLVAAAFAYVSLGRRAVGYRFTPLTLFH